MRDNFIEVTLVGKVSTAQTFLHSSYTATKTSQGLRLSLLGSTVLMMLVKFAALVRESP